MLSLTVTDSSPISAGIHPARLVWVVDLGIQSSPWGDKPQLVLGFELPSEIRADGRPAMLFKTFTATLSPKAALRQALAALVGPLTTGTTLALKDLVGRPAMVTVAHKPRDDGGVRAVIEAIEAPGKYEVPAMVGPGLVYDMTNPDPTVLEQLLDWIKAAIAQAKPTAGAPAAPPPAPAEVSKKIEAGPAPTAESASFDDESDF